MSESQVEVKFEKADEETLNVVSKYWNFSLIFNRSLKFQFVEIPKT